MRLINKARSYFNSPLPVGMTEFDIWSAAIIDLTGPIADPDSIKFALSNMIMHLKPDMAYVPKNYFVKCLRKTAASQVAGQVFVQVKERQAAAAAKAAEDLKLAEATAPQSEVANAETKTT